VLLLAAKPWSGSTLKRYRKRVAAISPFFFLTKKKKVDVSENAKKPIISAVLLLHLIKMSLVLLIERV